MRSDGGAVDGIIDWTLQRRLTLVEEAKSLCTESYGRHKGHLKEVCF